MQHMAPIAILALAVVMRLGYLNLVGQNDLGVFRDWGIAAAQHGLFSVYAQDSTVIYPPIFPSVTGILTDIWLRVGGSTVIEPGSTYVVLLKILPLLTELGIIAAVYFVLPPRTRLRWVLPIFLAIYPGLIVTTAFWGQTDALFTLPLVIAFALLQKEHDRASWVFFTVAILAKPQAVLALPVLMILTFRRYGWKSLLSGIGLMSLISFFVHAPFILVSGLESALRPYLSAADQFPVLTFNAFNLWYTFIPGVWESHPPLVYDLISDREPLIGLITANQLGLFLFVAYIFVLLFVMWRQSNEKREFVWLAAMYLGFFVLRTQIHERYLYPVAIFSILGIAADRRMGIIALSTCFTFSYNMITPSIAPFYWLGINILFTMGDIALHVALLNIVILAAMTWIMLTLPSGIQSLPINLMGAAMLVIGTIIGGQVLIPVTLPQDVVPLDATVDNTFRLAGYRLVRQEARWSLDLYWNAYEFNNRDYSLFVHVMDNGQIIAQDDGRPQGGNYPTWRWYRNRWIVTTHILAIPSDLQPVAIEAGLYDPNTMVRGEVVQNGQPLDTDAIRVWSEN